MKRRLSLLIVLLFSITVSAQRRIDQCSLEASFGANMAQGITGLSHFDAGFRYMFNEKWGAKIDFGSDKFNAEKDLGSKYTRYTVSGVANLGQFIDLESFSEGYFNMLAHAGLGYSTLKSDVNPTKDQIGNVVLGLTPQLFINENLALTLDASYIMNFSQHYNFDGTHPNETAKDNEFMGSIINASIGITFYFGQNTSRVDWP